jgi:hypothetical protein
MLSTGASRSLKARVTCGWWEELQSHRAARASIQFARAHSFVSVGYDFNPADALSDVKTECNASPLPVNR